MYLLYQKTGCGYLLSFVISFFADYISHLVQAT